MDNSIIPTTQEATSEKGTPEHIDLVNKLDPNVSKKLEELTKQKVDTELDIAKKQVFLDVKKQEIDKRISSIMQSTRTTFPMFLGMHNALRQRFSWYYNWHLKPASSAVHWFILTVYITTVGYKIAILIINH